MSEQKQRELKASFGNVFEKIEYREQLDQLFAHELCALLAIIKGNEEQLSFLLENADREVTHSLENIREAVQSMETCMDALKELRVLDSWIPERVDYAIDELAAVWQQQYGFLAQKEGKELEVRCDTAGMIYEDELIINSTMDRIVENAIRFAQKHIDIDILRDADGKKYWIFVEDDGDGFSTEAQKRCGEPFFSTDKSSGHIGLGLYTAKRLLAKSSKCLHIENRAQGGASVSFSVSM